MMIIFLCPTTAASRQRENRTLSDGPFKWKVKHTRGSAGERAWRLCWSVGQQEADRSRLVCGMCQMTHNIFMVLWRWSLSFQRLRPRLRGPPGPQRGDSQEALGRQLRAPRNRVGLKGRRHYAFTFSWTKLLFLNLLLTFWGLSYPTSSQVLEVFSCEVASFLCAKHQELHHNNWSALGAEHSQVLSM